MFIPNIESVMTKQGTGLESAEHLESDEACARIRSSACNAAGRLSEIQLKHIS